MYVVSYPLNDTIDKHKIGAIGLGWQCMRVPAGFSCCKRAKGAVPVCGTAP